MYENERFSRENSMHGILIRGNLWHDIFIFMHANIIVIHENDFMHENIIFMHANEILMHEMFIPRLYMHETFRVCYMCL